MEQRSFLERAICCFIRRDIRNRPDCRGLFVSDEEVSSIVDFLAEKNPGMQYNSQIEQQVNTAGMSGGTGGSSADDRDAYFVEAGKFIIEKEKASIGMLQRMFKIGFNRAARIMDQLCDAGVVDRRKERNLVRY